MAGSKSLTRKLMDKEDNWSLAELQEVIHWIRQALALVLGFVWGVIPLTGLASFVGGDVVAPPPPVDKPLTNNTGEDPADLG
eukprot:jgi/Pico_ML_1/54185/g4596.t1